ncbi:MAG: hypothetical protein K9M45_11835 [Kiritimatiellales bacterium]|nr:hypothetical protein [Kiritimatiellales bacterium]
MVPRSFASFMVRRLDAAFEFAKLSGWVAGIFFQCLENLKEKLPAIGKSRRCFSEPWK